MAKDKIKSNSYVLKVGHGDKGRFEMPLGSMEAKINLSKANITIKQFAKQLAKQLKIKNGTIEVFSLNFTYTKSAAKATGMEK